MVSMVGRRDPALGAVFDLDGVLVDTARFHFAAWQKIAAEHGFSLGDEVAESVKGVSRDEALAIVMRSGSIRLSAEEAARAASRKNDLYLETVKDLNENALLPGAAAALRLLHSRGIPVALASASKNARPILQSTGIAGYFSAIIDGTVVSRAKPDPEIFLAAAAALDLEPGECVVFEDAVAGIEGARIAGCRVVGIGDATVLVDADSVAESLADVDWGAEFGHADVVKEIR
jgi:beta-phosphoglucomutase